MRLGQVKANRLEAVAHLDRGHRPACVLQHDAPNQVGRAHCLGLGRSSAKAFSAASTSRRAVASWRRCLAAATPLNARDTSSPIGSETRTISPGRVGWTNEKMPNLIGAVDVSGRTMPPAMGAGCWSATLIRSKRRSGSWASVDDDQTVATRRPAESPLMGLHLRTCQAPGWPGDQPESPTKRPRMPMGTSIRCPRSRAVRTPSASFLLESRWRGTHSSGATSAGECPAVSSPPCIAARRRACLGTLAAQHRSALGNVELRMGDGAHPESRRAGVL